MAGAAELVLNQILEDDIEVEDELATEPVATPYLPAEGMSIPVPKSFGPMWEKRIKETVEADQIEKQIWDRCMELYRQCGNEGVKSEDGEYKYRLSSDADENIIRTNIRSIMRSTYMQNPHIEFTDMTKENTLGETLEYIIDFMMRKQTYPGINMKPKARRWILHGQLTNYGVIRLDYQPHEGSRQQAVDELQKLEKELENAKDKSAIKEIYAKLEILHQELPLSQGKGMMLTNVLSQCFIADPNCTMYDLSDADWTAEWFDEDRDLIRNKYYKKDDEGNWVLRANPNVTEQADPEPNKDVKDTVTDTVMGHRSDEQQELLKKGKVRCYNIYDKILKRTYLFSSDNWKHPLWVSDDDMGLSRYFRHFILAFGEPIESIIQPGEVSFYMGQVNEINRINRNAKRIRDNIFGAIVYNSKSVDKDEVTKLVKHMKNPNEVAAFGVATDENKKISEVIEVLAPPAFQYKEAFDTTQLRSAVDRMSATSEVDRGGQFKTNTTNDAVNYYAMNRQQSNTVIVDAIEDSFQALGWSMAEILVSKYSKEEITAMIGPEKAANFIPMSVPEFNQKYRMEIAAGSIEKPTSEFKKQEAMAITQALGQVGQAAPLTTLRVMFRVLKNAFTNFVVQDDDWATLAQEGQANLQKGVSTSGQPSQ